MTLPYRHPGAVAHATPGSLRVTGRQGWDQHPGVRTGHRLGRRERAADMVCRAAGSVTHLIVVTAGILAGVAAVTHGRHPDEPAWLAIGLAGLALAEVSLVLVGARRAERIATDLALYHLDHARRATAVAEDLRDELQRLHADVARIAAHTEVAGSPARRT